MTATHDHELTAARALVRDLSRVEPRNEGDRRFIATWAAYLDRAGDLARIGRWRLTLLRSVAASHGLCDHPQAIQAGGLD